tara:strand:- start:4540 stop:5031 length:492 start_codon:yes stop_codon:yes gene_type:complete
MTSIIENVVKNFSNNIGNGINLGVYYKSIVDHVIKTGDTTPLVKAINASINRGDTALTSQLRVTTGKIWIGAKIKTKANKVISIKIKNAKLSNSAVKALSDVAGQVSMRGSNWKKAFTPDTEPKAFDVALWAVRQATARPDQLEAMIAALQAQRATVSKKKAA